MLFASSATFTLTFVIAWLHRTTCDPAQGLNLWLQPLNHSHLQAGTFPPGFLWGVGTAAFPTEGSWNADGKGESVWDYFTHHTRSGAEGTADAASDSYTQWEEDLKSVEFLGVNAYAFSLSWPRLFPDGNMTSKPNRAGVEHYLRLIKRLKERRVEPVVTLFHWDLPQVLQEQYGGWLNPVMVEIFAEYATFCFRTFGADVRFWLTIHNPLLLAVQGYGTGAHAPGVSRHPADPFIVAHNLIRAHATVWHIYDRLFRPQQQGKVSITLGSHWVEPLHGQVTADTADLCQKSLEAVLGWFAEPIHGSGDYPPSLKAWKLGLIPEFTPQERIWIRGTADFFSLAFEPETLNVARVLARFGQLVTLDLRRILVWIHQTYSEPLVLVAESGWFSGPAVGVEDTVAIYLIKRFIIQAMQAMSVDGVKVLGYTVWSLLDGFEWNHAYKMRRGLFYIDFSQTPRLRKPKSSAHFYKQVVRRNGFPPDNNTRHFNTPVPCDFHFGISDSTLQVHLRPFSPQFTDPHLYRWNFSGDGTLKAVSGVMLRTRGAQCTDFLYIQRHLFLLGTTGSSHYRFALDWGQLMPDGDPLSVDPEKLLFYKCMLSEMRRKGIQPVVTLYHPSNRSPSLGLPGPLHANGGWGNQSTVEAFIKYARFCFLKLGALVPFWTTINEPNRLAEVFAGNSDDRRTVARHLLMAHAKVWRMYDTDFRSQQGAVISLALHADWVEPANPFVDSHTAAQERFLMFEIGRFLDPLLGQGASKGVGDSIGFSDTELVELKGALDFVALNHFTTRLVSPTPINPNHPGLTNMDHGCFLTTDDTWLSSHMRQAVVPWGLRKMLRWIKNHYGNRLPIIVTASGVDDQSAADDRLRQSYIRSYLQEALKARELDNVNLRGFYVWKLQDNHNPQFGLFTSAAHHSRPKASVNLYRDIITQRGFPSTSKVQPLSCRAVDKLSSCVLCSQIAENKPLVFFSVCVLICISMLSVLIVLAVVRRRRSREKKTINRIQRFPMSKVIYRPVRLTL